MFHGIIFNEKLMRKYLILNFLRTYGIQKLQILIDDMHYFELLLLLFQKLAFLKNKQFSKL